jgi:hypothetical protein
MRKLSHRSSWLTWLLSLMLAAPQGVVGIGQQPQPAQTTKPPAPTNKPAEPTTKPPAPTAQPADPTAKPAAQAAKPAAPATPPPGTNADTGWPRTVALKSGTVIWYQPQIESWVGQKDIVGWSAVSYLPTGAKEPALGTIKIEGPTRVALDDRVVTMDLRITEYNFTSLPPDQVKALVADVQALPVNERVLDLDRVLAYVSASPLQVKNVENIKADPPKVFSSPAPAILVNFDGEPVWSPVKDVDLRYAVNTNWDLFEFTPSKTLYLRYNQSWLEASKVEGPWKPAGKLPDSFSKLPNDENWKDVKSALPGTRLSDKTMPRVFVSTEPAELIVLNGALSYLKVEGADTLLWVNNTESDLFRMGATGDFYFLVAGRWFKAPSLQGPWTFATPSLPEDFKRIPVEHPRSRVLASVPGTRQATEAVLLATIPRTARVNKKEMKAPDVVYQGDPQFQAIEGATGVERAANTDKDIIKYGDLYYMCFQGVWFMSRSATGPWEVASSVPQQIYTIPASSPSHHVTYVTVEDDDDDEWVTFAYVAAYTGMMVGWGCAVWGTGWYYPPYVYYGGFYPAYYPYAHTYGMGAWYNPYTGGYGRGYAAYGPYGGVGMGASYNPRTGTYSRGAAAYGPYGSRSFGQAYNPRTGTYGQTRQGSNVYGNWGTSAVQRGDSWAQTAHAQNYRRGTSTTGVRTDSGAAAASRVGPGGNRTTVGRTSGGDIYAGRDGNVYRRGTGGGWEQSNGSGGWSSVDSSQRTQALGGQTGQTGTSTTTNRVGQLESDRTARTQGNQRTTDRSGWNSSGRTSAGARSYGGGGMRGGGGRRR